MRRKIGVWICCALFIALSCSDDDNAPTDPVPAIAFVDFVFVSGRTNSDSDTLKLTFNLADGDMDLGLGHEEEDWNPPYHDVNYFLSNGKGDTTKVGTKIRYQNLPPFINVKSEEKGDLITYRTKSKPGYEFLPPYEYPYSCKSYRYDSIFVREQDTAVYNKREIYLDRIMRIAQNSFPDVYVLKDTFYYEVNPHAGNMRLEFLVETSDGNFEAFEMPVNVNTCATVYRSNRIPRLDELTRGKTIRNGAYTIIGTGRGRGKLTYNFTSFSIKPLFGGKRIKLRITIEDRALHLSNTIETIPLEIPSI
jgi:hypothetical protein